MRLKQRLPDQIEIERLILRRPRVSDLDFIVGKANSWSVLQFTGLPFPYTVDHGRAFLAKEDRASHRPYVIADRQTEEAMGVIGLYEHQDTPVELGYWLGEQHWGQGLASEAIRALLNAAGDIGPIRAKVIAANSASTHLLAKIGFVVVETTTSALERHLGQPLAIMEWRA